MLACSLAWMLVCSLGDMADGVGDERLWLEGGQELDWTAGSGVRVVASFAPVNKKGTRD